jgi:hypothetical protein
MEETINKKYATEAEEIRENVEAIKNKKMSKKNLKKFKGALKGGRMMSMMGGRMQIRGATKKPKKKLRKPITKRNNAKKKSPVKVKNNRTSKAKKTTGKIKR